MVSGGFCVNTFHSIVQWHWFVIAYPHLHGSLFEDCFRAV